MFPSCSALLWGGIERALGPPPHDAGPETHGAHQGPPEKRELGTIGEPWLHAPFKDTRFPAFTLAGMGALQSRVPIDARPHQYSPAAYSQVLGLHAHLFTDTHTCAHTHTGTEPGTPGFTSTKMSAWHGVPYHRNAWICVPQGNTAGVTKTLQSSPPCVHPDKKLFSA